MAPLPAFEAVLHWVPAAMANFTPGAWMGSSPITVRHVQVLFPWNNVWAISPAVVDSAFSLAGVFFPRIFHHPRTAFGSNVLCIVAAFHTGISGRVASL
jgi:hypothetical protein